MTADRQQPEGRPEVWLLSKARQVRGELLQAVAWATLAGLLVVGQARLLALACQRLVIDGSTVQGVLPLAGGVAALALGRGLFSLLSERCALQASARLRQGIARMLYARLQLLGPAGRGGESTAALVETLTTGIDGLEPYLTRFLPQAALAAVLPLACLLFVLPLEWRSGLVLLFSAPFIPLFMILIGRGSERLNRRQWGRLSRMAGHLMDLVQGLADLKAVGTARRAAEQVANMAEEYRRGTMMVLRVAFLSALTLEFFATVGTAVVAVLIGFRLLHGQLGLGEGLFVLLLAPEFYLPLRNLGLSYHSRMQGIAAAERIIALLALPLPTGYGGTRVPPAGAPAISFEGVCFRYADERGGVQGVDLQLPAGSLTVLAGASGSGKSTLVRLLAGLARPDSGRITVDGQDLADLDPTAWRERLAWVPQQPWFFKGSLRDNLLLGRPDASQEEIEAALQHAGADRFIGRLPAGLQTELGDRGAGLSGGELRRLALARAFVRRASLVILDEPTAGLDQENEGLVLDTLERLAVGRTLLVISHRELTIARAGRVAVLAGGRLERVVSPSEYLASFQEAL